MWIKTFPLAVNTHNCIDNRYIAVPDRDYLAAVGTRMEDSDQGDLSFVADVQNNVLTKGLMY